MTKTEQRRLMTWRFKVLQRAGTGPRRVAQTCRHFGISRRAFYKWKKRYDEHGEAGLGDRPRTPHRSPRATPREVVSKILYLRQHYHFGPGKITDYLKRFHSVSVARSSVHPLLGRHGLSRLPANQKHRENRSHVLLPLPRWTPPRARVGYFGGGWQLSPLFRRVSIHFFTFEACSGFTRVAAREIANLPEGDIVPAASACAGQVATESYRQLPGGSFIHWSSAPLRGALNNPC